jgi:hypothetical protein
MKFSYSLLFFGMLFCLGCRIQKPTQGFIEQFNKPRDTTVLFDRVYYNIRKESYHYSIDYKNGIATSFVDTPFLDQPVFFTKSGVLLSRLNLTILEESDFKIDSLRDNYKSNTEGWGIYSLLGDTINATIYVNFTGGKAFARNQFFECYYRGVLKNSDTLLHWQLVEPYPEINKAIPGNLEYLNFLKNPVDLHLKNVEVKKFIDPNKAWINKYRVQKM